MLANHVLRAALVRSHTATPIRDRLRALATPTLLVGRTVRVRDGSTTDTFTVTETYADGYSWTATLTVDHLLGPTRDMLVVTNNRDSRAVVRGEQAQAVWERITKLTPTEAEQAGHRLRPDPFGGRDPFYGHP